MGVQKRHHRYHTRKERENGRLPSQEAEIDKENKQHGKPTNMTPTSWCIGVCCVLLTGVLVVHSFRGPMPIAPSTTSTKYPAMVTFDRGAEASYLESLPQIEITKYPTHGHRVSMETSTNGGGKSRRGRNSENCTFPKPPPLHNLVACNLVHGLDIMPHKGNLVYINSGGQRAVFKLTDPADHSEVALKVPRYAKDFSDRKFASATLDTMIMERLQSSPYVASIYASCGTSQVMEYAPAGNLHELINMARQTQIDNMTSIDKLRICYQISTGLADLQDIGVAHNDICCHQYIHVDGIYKLNDFHQSKYMKRNINASDEFCLIDPVYNSEQLKMYPPELVLSKSPLDLSKVDTYMMANTMFFVLCKKWMYEGITRRKTSALMRQGIYTNISTEYLESPDPAIRTMVKAIKAGWNHNPMKRATARQISNWLSETLQEIERKEELGVVQVAIPPLPDNFEHSESDFWRDLEL